MDVIEIEPVRGAFEAVVRVPGSKSITNRALPLAAMAAGGTELTGVLFADDTWQMINALQVLGYRLELDQQGERVRVAGLGREIPNGAGKVIACGNSGTTIRFLTAMLGAGGAGGETVLDGVARMRERPIGQLVDQLRVLGAEIGYDVKDGYPPVRIQGKGLRGGGCQFSDAKSSQYISAVLMAAPYAETPVTVSLVGPVTSEPYVVMTLRMMEQFGAGTAVHDQCGKAEGGSRAIQVGPGVYRPPVGGVYAIEPDASNASYFLAAAAIVPGARVTVAGLGKGSLQGDVAFAEVLGRMGAAVEWLPEGVRVTGPAGLRGVTLDMNHIPDMVQTLCVVALFAEGETVVTNVWNLRVKETDRLAALEAELRKLGAGVETGRDWIKVTPPAAGGLHGGRIATYEDHRMAMAFGVAGLRVKGVVIEEPGCTGKTYPGYFGDLRGMVGG